jgi:hypothetical protein
VNVGFHPDAPLTVIAVVSITNICLMVIAAFYGPEATSANANWRVKSGLIAVLFGLCSQVLYCLMLVALVRGIVPSYSGNSFNHFQLTLSNTGGLLSIATFVAALFGRGFRRYSGVWVAVTGGCLWSLSGLGAALGSLFK